MKKGILMLAAAFTMVLTSCKENAADKVKAENVKATSEAEAKAETNEFPVMTFEEKNYDFGTINEGEVVNHTFTFTNTGEAPLVITAAKGSCGCTVPDWPEGESIAPGEKSEIAVRFNSRNQKGTVSKTVRITANTEKGTEMLRIRANVIPKEKASGTPVKS